MTSVINRLPSELDTQEAMERRRAARRLISALLINIILFFLNEVLTIDLGIFFIRPEKIGVLLGALICFRYIPVAFFSRRMGWLLHAFLAYNAILCVSALYSPILPSLLNKANILIFNGSQAMFAYGVAGAIARAGSLEPLKRLVPWYLALGLINVAAGYMDFVVGRRVIPSGVRSADYTYGIGIMGFHADRVYLGEYIVVAVACLIGSAVTSRERIFLIIFTIFGGAQLVLMNSYTGMVGFILIYLVYFFYAPVAKKIALIPLVMLILSVIGFFYLKYAPDDVKEYQLMKFENRVSGGETTEWRYISSLLIWERTLANPSLLGEGYRASEKLLEYYSGVRSSPHTVISIVYEQGIVGAVVFLYFFVLFLSYVIWFMKHNRSQLAVKYLVIGLSLISILRFAFYYQIRNEQSFIFSVAFLAAAWYLRGQLTTNGGARYGR